MQNMKAIVVRSFGGPSALQHVTNWPLPKAHENNVCVRVHCAGVNPVDTYIRSGLVSQQSLPFIAGSDGAGVVEECGSAVTKFKKGDRVFFSKTSTGSYAQFCLVPEEKVSHLQGLSFEEGACIGIPYYTAYRAMHKTPITPQHTVLVHGASGGVGLACVQLASKLGARVLGTAGTEQGKQLVRQNGASAVFNHREEGYMQEIKKVGKVDVVLEMRAAVNLQKDLDLITPQGSIVVIGSRGATEMHPRSLMATECRLTGVSLTSTTFDEWNEMTAYMDRHIREGTVKPVIGSRFSMAEAVQAHEEVIKHTGGSHGKILISIPQD